MVTWGEAHAEADAERLGGGEPLGTTARLAPGTRDPRQGLQADDDEPLIAYRPQLVYAIQEDRACPFGIADVEDGPAQQGLRDRDPSDVYK
jgi:hypothetical protein